MKRKSNKLISLLLALTMMLNVLPLGVWATSTSLKSADGWLYDVNEDNVAIITGYNGPAFTDGVVEIPAAITNDTGTYSVRIINDDAFSGRDDVVTVTMTNKIDYIFGGAFKNCTNLEKVTLSANLRVLDNVAFYGCTKLTSITLPDSLERMGEYVFTDSGLISLTYEGTEAQWDQITKGTEAIPTGITPDCIGTEGFVYELDEDDAGAVIITAYNGTCPSNLTIEGSVDLGTADAPDVKDVLAVGEGAFKDHTELNSVIIERPITYLHGMAFRNCSNLSSITLPSTLRRINGMAFRNCSSLESILIPDNVVSLGEYVFADCKKLSNITLPSNLESIDRYAFDNCTSLTTINYEGTEAEWAEITIGSNAIPDDVDIICSDTVTNLENWTFSLDDKNNAFITGYDGELSGAVNVPSEVKDDNGTYVVRFIGEGAFEAETGITSVTLPGRLRRINDGAFSGCTALKSINIPENVEYIGAEAFKGCTVLSGLELHKGIKNIGVDAFYGCTTLITYLGTETQWAALTKNSNIPSTVTVKCTGKDGWDYEIDQESGDLTILGYNGDISDEFNTDGVLKIPDEINVGTEAEPDNRTVCWIGTEAFMDLEKLTSVVIPDTVLNLYAGAFNGCTNLVSVTLSKNLRRINQGAFIGCESLTTINIPDKVVEIGPEAFQGTALATIIFAGTQYQWNHMNIAGTALPSTVTTIRCTGTIRWLYEVNKDGFAIITGYSGEFVADTANNIPYGTVIVPSKITDDDGDHYVHFIENDAFNGRSDVVSVTLPETVHRIGNRAFKDCENLTSINIPDNVYYIGNDTFRGCESLTAITLPILMENIGDMAFVDCGSETTPLAITYKGVQNQWDRITKGNNAIGNATVTCSGEHGWIFGLTDEGQDGYAILMGHTDPLVGEVTLPETDKEGRIVQFIAAEIFQNETGLTKLTIPDTYVRINPESFTDCTSLTEIKLPLNLRFIGNHTFSGCTSLEKVIYPGRDDRWSQTVEVIPNSFEPHNLDELLVFGDDGIYDLSGTVKLSNGTPVEGAIVTLTREDGTVDKYTTLEDGAYQFKDLSYKNNYPLCASTEGYPTKNIAFQPEKDSVYDFIFYTAGEYEDNIYLAHLRENEIVNFNSSIADVKGDQIVFANTLSGLVETDEKGQIVPALAESWTHNSGYTQWTFKIRDGVNWVDVNGNPKWDDLDEDGVKDENEPYLTITAADFATTLEWRLNGKKNPEHHCGPLLHDFIVGAKNYTYSTDRMSNDAAWALSADSAKFTETVGISVDDENNSITFNLTKSATYFPTILGGSSFLNYQPMSQAMIDEVGLHNVNSMDNTTMWYCGPYLMTDFVDGCYKVYEPNPYYWDLVDGDATDCKLFKKVVVTMVGSYEDAYELFEAGQLDYVEIDGEVANDLIKSGSQYSKNLISKILSPYSYQMHWNYNKFDPDNPKIDPETGEQMYDRYSNPLYHADDNWNIAIANEDFRLSLYYGWELSNYYARTNPVDPLKSENYTNTMNGITYLSDGTDYTESVKARLGKLDAEGKPLGLGDYNGETMVRLNTTQAQIHKEAAMTELLAAGVTFPVEIDYYVEDNTVALETLAVLRNCLVQSLGEDYVTINARTYEDSSSKEVRDPQLQSLAINGWGMDYGDPINNLAQFALGETEDESYYSHMWSNIMDLIDNTPQYAVELVECFETYDSMLTVADNLTGDARLNKLADAEAYLINHGLVTPCIITTGYCIGYIVPDSMTSNTMKNWIVSDTLIGGGEIHDDGIAAMGIWKPQGKNDYVFDWILTEDGTLYITGNGSLEGVGNNGNTPWQKYKNDIKRIIVSPAVTGLNETGAFKELNKVTEVEFGEYTGVVPSGSTYNLRAGTDMEIQTYSILETIGKSTFEGCTSLESIKIPTSVETIGENAFADTGLTKINYAGDSEEFAEIDGCDDFLFDTYQNLEGEHQFADQNSDNGINIADVDLLYRKAQ